MIKFLKKLYYTYKVRQAEVDFKERGEMGYWGAFPEKQGPAWANVLRWKQKAGLLPVQSPLEDPAAVRANEIEHNKAWSFDERVAAGYEPKS